jgi:hypothetical protein
MINPMHMDRQDKQFVLGAIVAPLLVWWFITGRRKYSAKGMN